MRGDAKGLLVWGLVMGLVFSGVIDSSFAKKPPPVDDEVTVEEPEPNRTFKEGEVIIKFKKDFSSIKKDVQLKKLILQQIKEFRKLGISVVEIDPRFSVQEALEILKLEEVVEYAEPNYVVEANDLTPNDTYFENLWGMQNLGQTGGVSGADIGGPSAWEITTGSRDLVVAVVDTGIDYNHEDLADNMWMNGIELNGIPGEDDDGNGYVDDIFGINAITGSGDPMDDHFHGTHCAGTIGGVGGNSLGVTGVNWDVQLMGCKFLDSGGRGYTADAIECIEYIREMKSRGANIVASNNSWGCTSELCYSQALYDAVKGLMEDEILFVAAAGNSRQDNDIVPHYPSNFDLPNVISVAASDHTDELAVFSNFGKRTVHLGSPGVNILSSVLGNSYSYKSGTSMAAPHVTGVAALLKAQDPTRNWIDIKNLLLAGSEPTEAFSDTTLTGRRLSASGALDCTGASDGSSMELSILDYPEPAVVGEAVNLSAMSIDCELPVGPVTVSVCGDDVAILLDDGIYPDLVEGDGIFSASWIPQEEASSFTFSSDAGWETTAEPFSVAFNSVDPPLTAEVGMLVTMEAAAGDYCPSQTVEYGFEVERPDSTRYEICSWQSGASCVWDTAGYPIDNYKLQAGARLSGSTIESWVEAPYELTTDQPVITIDNITVDEDAGPASFSVTLSKGSVDAISVDYATSDGSAVAGEDFESTAGVLTFNPGELAKTIDVNIIEDALFEGDELFYVVLSNPTGDALISSGGGIGRIVSTVVEDNPDLLMAGVSGPSIYSGSNITVTNTVANPGGASGAFYVGFYLSTDTNVTTSDLYVGRRAVYSLVGGASDTRDTVLAFPSNLPPGTYYLGAVADYQNAIAESDETNNGLAGNLIEVKVDLVMTGVSGPAIYSGSNITVTNTVTNLGPATGSFYVGFYLSTDASVTTNDLYVGRRAVYSLAGGASDTKDSVLGFPPNLPPGIYYLGAVADYLNAIAESDETNNGLAGNQIAINTDLVMTGVSGPATYSGSNITVTNTVTNLGPATEGFYVGFYLSTDTSVTTGDLYVGRRAVYSLAGGASDTRDSVLAFPTNLPSGTYYLGAVADYQNVIVESDETNNSLAGNLISIE